MPTRIIDESPDELYDGDDNPRHFPEIRTLDDLWAIRPDLKEAYQAEQDALESEEGERPTTKHTVKHLISETILRAAEAHKREKTGGKPMTLAGAILERAGIVPRGAGTQRVEECASAKSKGGSPS